MTTWKTVERKIADLLGGQRVPVSGRARGDAPDIAHAWLSLEVKHRTSLPNWMHSAMSQAEASARGNQLPMVIYHQTRQGYGNSFVMLRLSDFVDWFGGGRSVDNLEKIREAGL